MEVKLDIAALVAAVLWPLLLFAIFLAYRKKIPLLFEWLSGRLTKLEVAGISLELATTKPMTPEWAGYADLRHETNAMQINDSMMTTFVQQLNSPETAEFVEVNLGLGHEWLTSRLYILAILFARFKGVRAFVFLDTAQGVNRRYCGWAFSDHIRWALGQRYPLLETAFAQAYSQVTFGKEAVIVSDTGRLGYPMNPHAASPGVRLLQNFLQGVQRPSPIKPDLASSGEDRWELLSGGGPPGAHVYEHAVWLDSNHLADLLGDNLHLDALNEQDLKALEPAKQYEAVLQKSDPYIALVDEVGRFKGLLNRCVILGQAVKQMTAVITESRS